MIRTLTFTHGDASVTVRESIGIDRIDQRSIYGKLTYNRDSSRDINRASTFAEWLCRTVSVTGDFGFKWATLDSDKDEMQAAFDSWQAWPTDLMDKWVGALYTVSIAPGEPEMQPDVDPNV